MFCLPVRVWTKVVLSLSVFQDNLTTTGKILRPKMFVHCLELSFIDRLAVVVKFYKTVTTEKFVEQSS